MNALLPYINILLLAALTLPVLAAADSSTLEKAVNTGHQIQLQGQKSQVKVDTLASQSRQMLEEYQRLVQQGDYQKAYNEQLKVRQVEQREEIKHLKNQIAEIKITQQRLLPLLQEKTETLATFIRLDLPFQQEDRLASVDNLRQVLRDSKTTMAEKFRRVMELYQTENDYNYDIAAYRDVVNIEGEKRSVEILRIGRSALFYQSLDQQQSALWNKDESRWQLLDKAHNLNIRKALRVAKQETAPHLLTLPQPFVTEGDK